MKSSGFTPVKEKEAVNMLESALLLLEEAREKLSLEKRVERAKILLERIDDLGRVSSVSPEVLALAEKARAFAAEVLGARSAGSISPRPEGGFCLEIYRGRGPRFSEEFIPVESNSLDELFAAAEMEKAQLAIMEKALREPGSREGQVWLFGKTEKALAKELDVLRLSFKTHVESLKSYPEVDPGMLRECQVALARALIVANEFLDRPRHTVISAIEARAKCDGLTPNEMIASMYGIN